LPDDPRERPLELEGGIVRTEHNDAWLRWCSDRWSTAHERLLPVSVHGQQRLELSGRVVDRSRRAHIQADTTCCA
jgi:hypothetical protein